MSSPSPSPQNDEMVENIMQTLRITSEESLFKNNTNPITHHINDEEESEEDVEEEDESEEDEYENEENGGGPVSLGLVEKLEVPSPFISIAGGFPVWLDPINLPSGTSIICGFCHHPLQFVLQVYATPFEKESAFHRALSIFMCPSMKCLLQDQHEQRKHPSDDPSRRFHYKRKSLLGQKVSRYSVIKLRNDGIICFCHKHTYDVHI